MLRGSSQLDRSLLWLTPVVLLLAACGQLGPGTAPTDTPVGAEAAAAETGDDGSDVEGLGTGSDVAAVRVPDARPEPPAARVAVDPGWAPFATVAGIELVNPSPGVEMVGFHESNHDGAQQLDVLAGAVAPMTLDSRDRGTGSRTAADVVVDPDLEVRSPVTGTVLRAGTYVLYCDHFDDFVVIAPDARPDWEVKLLHIDGVRVSAGDRVEAGVTVLAPHPTPLPFTSQVDEHTAEPSWPHVHIEVVDPAIPSGSSGSDC